MKSRALPSISKCLRDGAVSGAFVNQQSSFLGTGQGLYTTTTQGTKLAAAYSPTSAGLYGSSHGAARVVGSPTSAGLYGSSGARVTSSPGRYGASGTVYGSPTRSFSGSPGQAQLASRSYAAR